MKFWKKLLIYISIINNSACFATPKIINKVAAIVNDSVILESEINDLMKIMMINFNNEIQQSIVDVSKIRTRILERLIINKIILQTGQKLGITINNKYLEQAINNIANQHNLNINQIKNLLKKNQVSYSTYRNYIREEMIINEIRNDEVRRRIIILPQEVTVLAKQISDYNDYHTEINLSHFLIKKPKNLNFKYHDVNFTTQIFPLIERIRQNENFDKLKMEYSKSQILLKGGIMGWRYIQELPSIFSQMLITAKKGDIIGPIRSGIGFHLLKVNDLRNYKNSIFVTEVHIRHILLKTSPIVTSNQVKLKLEQIAKNIRNKKISFENAAREFSQDLKSAKQGGDLGWKMIDYYGDNFKSALIKLGKGQVSPPVSSNSGWHIIELLDIRNVDKTKMMQKKLAYRILFNRKFSEEVLNWTQKQRVNAYVKVISNQ